MDCGRACHGPAWHGPRLSAVGRIGRCDELAAHVPGLSRRPRIVSCDAIDRSRRIVSTQRHTIRFGDYSLDAIDTAGQSAPDVTLSTKRKFCGSLASSPQTPRQRMKRQRPNPTGDTMAAQDKTVTQTRTTRRGDVTTTTVTETITRHAPTPNNGDAETMRRGGL